jgi:diphthamide biosynthesis protein 7
LTSNGEGPVVDQIQSTHVQTVPLDSAVLDIEWTLHEAELGCMLCVATSTGSLEFLTFDAGAAELEHTSSKQITEPDTLVLDLLWHPTRADTIAVTLSDGIVALCQSNDSTKPWSPSSQTTTTELATHSLEPWTLAFSPDASHVFSGGDDAVLRAIQLSSSDESSTPSPTALWIDRKTHEAGVTAILLLATDLLITGSYDDRIRLIAAPPVGRRQVLAQLDLGGGVWRLRMLDDGGVSSGADDDRYVTFSLYLFLLAQYPESCMSARAASRCAIIW